MIEQLVPRHERALGEGFYHLYCASEDCRELRSRGRARYMGVNVPGGTVKCISCGRWYEVGIGGVLSPD